jgi:hypothetical protein
MIPWHMGVSTHRHWGLNEEIRVRRDVQNRASSQTSFTRCGSVAIAMREYENLAAFYLQAPSCIKNDDGEEAPCTSTTNWMI